MAKGKKRKRDAEYPRISYYTPFRTFDRLFKEESLSGMKTVIRKKLGLESDVYISLAQIRGEKAVDLEDDDDFDAFYSLAHATKSVNVRVNVGRADDAEAVSTTSGLAMSSHKKSGSPRVAELSGVKKGKAIIGQPCNEEVSSESATPQALSDSIVEKQKLTKRRETNGINRLARDSAVINSTQEPTRHTSSPSFSASDIKAFEDTSPTSFTQEHGDGELTNEQSTISQKAAEPRLPAKKGSKRRHKAIPLLEHATSSVGSPVRAISNVAETNEIAIKKLKSSHIESEAGDRKVDLHSSLQQSLNDGDQSAFRAANIAQKTLNASTAQQGTSGPQVEIHIDDFLPKLLAARRTAQANVPETPGQKIIMPHSCNKKATKKKAITVSDAVGAERIPSSPLQTPQLSGDREHISTYPLHSLSPSHNLEEYPAILEGISRQRLEESEQRQVSSSASHQAFVRADTNTSRSYKTANDGHDQLRAAPVPDKAPLLSDSGLVSLIRGPKLRVTDKRFPESSDEEPAQELEEEDESGSRQRFRNANISDSSYYSSSSIDGDASSVMEASLPRARHTRPNVVLGSDTDLIVPQATAQQGEKERSEATVAAEPCSALAQGTAESDARSIPQGTMLVTSKDSISLARPNPVQMASDAPRAKAASPPTAAPTLLNPLTSQPVMSSPTTSGRINQSSTRLGIIARMKSRRGSNKVESPGLSKASAPSQADTAQGTPQDRTKATTGTRSITPTRMDDNVTTVLPARLGRANTRQDGPSSTKNDTPWVTLNPPSSTPADANSTVMIDELEPSSPLYHMDVETGIPNNVGEEVSQDRSAKDPALLVPAGTHSSQPEDVSQNGVVNDSVSNDSDDENEVEAVVQQSKAKAKAMARAKYRPLSDISSEHGIFSTPVNARPVSSTPKDQERVMDMYGRKGDEIESESDSDSDDSEAEEQSHVPKWRRAGVMRTRTK